MRFLCDVIPNRAFRVLATVRFAVSTNTVQNAAALPTQKTQSKTRVFCDSTREFFARVNTCRRRKHSLTDFFCDVFFPRMRSEGFPFIVGVWGWTCVRVVLVVSSSSPRRRLVVASSSSSTR